MHGSWWQAELEPNPKLTFFIVWLSASWVHTFLYVSSRYNFAHFFLGVAWVQKRCFLLLPAPEHPNAAPDTGQEIFCEWMKSVLQMKRPSVARWSASLLYQQSATCHVATDQDDTKPEAGMAAQAYSVAQNWGLPTVVPRPALLLGDTTKLSSFITVCYKTRGSSSNTVSKTPEIKPEGTRSQ